MNLLAVTTYYYFALLSYNYQRCKLIGLISTFSHFMNIHQNNS